MRWEGPVAGIPDATVISVAALPADLPGGEPAGMHAQATHGRLLQSVPGVARFLVRDGMTIEVAAEAAADPRAVDMYLYGVARAALLYQCKVLVEQSEILLANNTDGDFIMS